MKTHIGPIYVILGCMALAALSLGANPVEHHADARVGELAKASAMLKALPAPGEMFVVVSPRIDDELATRIELAVARAKARKPG